MPGVTHLTVRGFKSIPSLMNLELNELTAFIGPNGSGKSNLFGVFRLLSAIGNENFQVFVAKEGGPDSLLHRGRKITPAMEIECFFGSRGYAITLTAANAHLAFAREETHFGLVSSDLGGGHFETNLTDPVITEADEIAKFVCEIIGRWRVYHFLDTSQNSGIRQAQAVRDNLRLKTDGENLAPFLRLLHEIYPDHFNRILRAFRLVLPQFGEIVYRQNIGERMDLEWFDKNDPDTIHSQHQLSDGTLRFLCLATLLLQPEQLQPDTILIDEPELGLHPAAIEILANMLEVASESKQILVSTQSAELISYMRPENIVVTELQNGETAFQRLDANKLARWLDNYSLGELWNMNVLGGVPGL